MKIMKKRMPCNQLLKKIYESYENPGCLSSIEKLFNQAREIDSSIKRRDVIKFLRTNDSYTLHKPLRYNFKRRRCFFPFPGHTICVDSCYVNKYSKCNTKYLIFLIDGMSKYLTIFPVKSLNSTSIVPVLDSFFLKNIFSYRYVYTDLGGEYCSKPVQQLYSKYNLKWYSNHSKSTRNPIVERVILTIKRRIIRYITHTQQEAFLPILDKMVYGYNISPHRGLMNNTPMDVHLSANQVAINNLICSLYKHANKRKKSLLIKYEPGQVVRISSLSTKFKRVTSNNYTTELFKILSVDTTDIPAVYKISELDTSAPILGIFYAEELSAVTDSGKYRIKIRRTRKEGSECLIQFIDFPNSEPRWVKKTALMKL